MWAHVGGRAPRGVRATPCRRSPRGTAIAGAGVTPADRSVDAHRPAPHSPEGLRASAAMRATDTSPGRRASMRSRHATAAPDCRSSRQAWTPHGSDIRHRGGDSRAERAMSPGSVASVESRVPVVALRHCKERPCTRGAPRRHAPLELRSDAEVPARAAHVLQVGVPGRVELQDEEVERRAEPDAETDARGGELATFGPDLAEARLADSPNRCANPRRTPIDTRLF